MKLYQILTELVKNPLVPRFYRELRDYYLSIDKINESSAIDYLIECKFGGKNDSFDDSSIGAEQRRYDTANFGVDSTITS
jgi:hypothetical protein